MKRLFIIDGNSLVFRSFHAFSGPAELTSKGKNVGMVYGFLSSLLMICRHERPDLLAVTFDTGVPTFRHKMYDKYKAHRPPMDDDLRQQLPLLYEIIDLMKIPQIALDGWEADDVMGTLGRLGESAGMEVFHVTGDKDFYQLVTDKVKVFTLPTRSMSVPVTYDPQGVKDKFGVLPEKVIDVLGLMGDTSDNVPGVPLVGPKKAVDLVNRFGGFDEVLAGAHQITQPKLRQNLIEFADQARLSRLLVTIDTNAPIDVRPENLTFGPLNNADIRRRLTELEFSSIINQLDALEKPPERTKQVKGDYEAVTSPEQLDEMINTIRNTDLLSIDTETTSVDPMSAELVGMSFSIEEKHGWYVAANFFKGVPQNFSPPPQPTLRENTSRELAFILEKLKPIYADKNLPKTGQNLKYDILVLSCYDVTVGGVAFDTMLASHLLDSSARQHNIDVLAEKHLDYRKIPTKRLIGSGSKQISMADVALDTITEYACEDTDIALRLTNLFKPGIAEEGLGTLLMEQELPLIPVLVRMEKWGVTLDTELLNRMSIEFQVEMDENESDVHALAGYEFNLNSTQQLADVLFNKLGLPTGRKTKFGFSTDISELERLAPIHDLPKKLLRFRHLSKLKSTYIDALPLMINPLTGRVHTSYSQTVAATGRLSSTDPNLQNIPIRSEEGGRIRKAFIAGEPGWLILSADYSQVELRIMAHLSGDERMIEAFRGCVDIHRSTASWMNDIPPELITSDMRRQAKEVNFGVLYGMGEYGLSQRLGISRKRAREFIEQYFSNFPRVRQYIDEIHEKAKIDGYVETMMGRRRPLPEINSRNFNIRQNAKRIAINTPIQGSAADLIKRAMINVHRMLEQEGFQARMLMQVHDELVFETPPDEVERLAERLIEVMGNAMELKVPLEVDASWGESWLDAHE